MDLLTVVMHELGHAMGLEHEDAGEFGIMGAVLDTSPGLGLAVVGTAGAAAQTPAEAAAGPVQNGKATGQDPGSWASRITSALGLGIDWQDRADGGWRDLWPFGATRGARASNLVEFRIDRGAAGSEEDGGLELVGVALGAEDLAGEGGTRSFKVDWDV